MLDKIVPGYYHRRMEDGEVCQSTCCNNTATENAMCERLVVDDIVHWARNYKVGLCLMVTNIWILPFKSVFDQLCDPTSLYSPWLPPQIDGFRFDIMGHLLVSTLEKMRSQLDKLTLEKDGVDGR